MLRSIGLVFSFVTHTQFSNGEVGLPYNFPVYLGYSHDDVIRTQH